MKSRLRATSSSFSSTCRGKTGAPPPRVTGACWIHTSSSSPASWTCPTRSPPADDPDVLVASGLTHPRVDLRHGGRREPDLLCGSEVAVGEDPGGGVLDELGLVVEQPLPRGSAHRRRTHPGLEGVEPHVRVACDVARREPVEGVLGRRDEPVEGGAGVVDRRHHPTVPPTSDSRTREGEPVPHPGEDGIPASRPSTGEAPVGTSGKPQQSPGRSPRRNSTAAASFAGTGW